MKLEIIHIKSLEHIQNNAKREIYSITAISENKISFDYVILHLNEVGKKVQTSCKVSISKEDIIRIRARTKEWKINNREN